MNYVVWGVGKRMKIKVGNNKKSKASGEVTQGNDNQLDYLIHFLGREKTLYILIYYLILRKLLKNRLEISKL